MAAGRALRGLARLLFSAAMWIKALLKLL